MKKHITLKDGTELSQKEIKKYNMGGTIVPTIKPRFINLSKKIQNKLINFVNEAEEKYGIKYNRLRFDLAITEKGDAHIYEVNTGNPLGGFTSSEVMRLHGFDHEAFGLEEKILNIFKDKIAVIATHESNTFFNSELNRFRELFDKNNLKVIFTNWRNIKGYLDNDNYIIWYMGELNLDRKTALKFFKASNIYGGKLRFGVGVKGNLTTKNFPNSSLIAPNSEIISPMSAKYIVPNGKVAKIFNGERNYGGKGVFKEGESIKVDKFSREILLQDLIKSRFEIDIICLRSEYGFDFIGFQRIAKEGDFLANLSQGGVYAPSMLSWI